MATTAYTVSLTAADKVYKATGATIVSALEKLKPELVKSRCFLIAKKGQKESKILLAPFHVKRMLVNRVYRELLDKRLNTILR